MPMKQVKVYNVAKFIEDNCDDRNLTAYGTDASWAILEGPDGILVVDNEAVHYKFGSGVDQCEIDCCKNDGGMYMMPSCTATVYVAAVMSEAETHMEPLGSFVRRFGSRIEHNYDLLLQSIKGIGLNPQDYPRDAE